jgi:hypothetical protein
MMPPREIPAAFEREQGCTEADWLGWLPGAVGSNRLSLGPPGHAEVTLGGGGGRLVLRWRALPDRRIALIRLPRLHVEYRFDETVAPDARAAFMRRFDLFLHRGGG